MHSVTGSATRESLDDAGQRARFFLRRAGRTARRCALACLLAVAFGGCAHMDEAECQSADWYGIGFEDGAAGAPAGRVGDHREACARHGVTPDLTAYRTGREEGLGEFCRPANGYRVGESGAAYHGVCPRHLEPAFLVAYRAGRELFEVAAAVREVERELLHAEQRLAAVREDLEAAQAELIRDGVSTERRATLLTQVYELSRRQGSLENEIVRLRVELDRREAHLADTRNGSDW
jgi:hypothetical protein